jgi:hypothetical protein
MSINTGKDKNIPRYEACYQTAATQEEIYLETTEEQLRANLTSESSRTIEYRRTKLQLDWLLEMFHEQCR